MASVDEAHKRQIETIVGAMRCPKDFSCCEAGFIDLCKAEDRSLPGYLDCLDEKSKRCVFSLSFGHSRLCKCPLRVYLGKNLKL